MLPECLFSFFPLFHCAGYALKQRLLRPEFIDMGCYSTESSDYPDIAHLLDGPNCLGVLPASVARERVASSSHRETVG